MAIIMQKALLTWPWSTLLLFGQLIIGTTMRVKTVEVQNQEKEEQPGGKWINMSDLSSSSGSAVSEFAGGHSSNLICDPVKCEFKKTHDDDQMDRFENELRFLKEASVDPLFKDLVPAYKRVEEHYGKPYMVMTDVLAKSGFKDTAVIADFKLGLQSWKPNFHGKGGADSKKRAKMEKLDSSTTTKTLGVRATSVQLPPSIGSWRHQSVPSNATYRRAGRAAVKKGLVPSTAKWIAGSTPRDFARIVNEYLPTPSLRKQFVQQIQPFIDTFKVQKTYRFTGASLFVYYNGVGAGTTRPNLGMVMIDFPHTIGSPQDPYGEIDTGVLTGLSSLQAIAAKKQKTA